MKKRLQNIFLCMSLIIFVCSTTMLIYIFSEYKKADDIYKSVENSVFTLPLENVEISWKDNSENNYENIKQKNQFFEYNHKALLNINKDAAGYIQIPDLNLLLPVVQGIDNEFYLNHTVTGEYSKNGTLFIDYRIDDGLEAKNAVIYGHNMKNGAMFGNLRKYLNKDFFKDADKNIYIYMDGYVYEYQIYSIHTAEVKSRTYTINFYDDEDFNYFYDEMLRLSYYDADINLDTNEICKTITLSTCTNDDKIRLVIQAVRVREYLN